MCDIIKATGCAVGDNGAGITCIIVKIVRWITDITCGIDEAGSTEVDCAVRISIYGLWSKVSSIDSKCSTY